MAATLRMANQNSNSPKFLTPARLMAVKTTMKIEGEGPDGDDGPDGEQQSRRAQGFGGDHHDELQPPQPAHRGAGGLPQGTFGVHRERAAGGVGGGHFAQRPHHQDDERSSHQVRNQHGRPGGLHSGAGAQEEAGANSASQPHHGELARFHAVAEVGFRPHVRGLHCHAFEPSWGVGGGPRGTTRIYRFGNRRPSWDGPAGLLGGRTRSQHVRGGTPAGVAGKETF